MKSAIIPKLGRCRILTLVSGHRAMQVSHDVTSHHISTLIKLIRTCMLGYESTCQGTYL